MATDGGKAMPDLVAALRECPAGRATSQFDAALAQPEHEARRCELATALRLRGEAWADLIETQLQTGALSDHELDRHRELLSRQLPILECSPALHDALREGALGMRQGLVERATLSPEALLADAEALFVLAPLRSISLNGASVEQARALGRLHQLGRLHHLGMSGRELGDDGVGALIQSPHLRALTTLDLYDVGIGDATLRLLGAQDVLPALRRLSLGETRHSREGLAALLRRPSIAALRELVVDGHWLDDGAIDELAAAPGLELETLTLIHGRIGPALRALASSRVVTKLRRLHLTRGLRDAGATLELLAGLEQLEVLGLTGWPLGHPVVDAVCRPMASSRLVELTLSETGLDDAAARTLAESDIAQLAWLDLSSNAIGNDGAAALARARFAPRLTRLGLEGNQLGSRGAAALVEGTASLVALDLSANPLGDDGARELAAAPALGQVELLMLAGCAIGPAGARALLDSPHLQQAKRIVLDPGAGREVWEELSRRRAGHDPLMHVGVRRWC
ncbi:MAG: hypothetical protein JNJ54_36020 [Myxococcaceae bacterium]|nr:hypothetical protein [Myxococcaceae bacterium]